MKDYYYILGLKEDANQTEIKKAYRKLSLKFHPDKNEGDKFFEERFKDIQEAYETLSNETRRTDYDTKRGYTNKSGGQSYSGKQSNSIAPPKIIELKADRYTIKPGDVVKISWNTENATSVNLNCFDGPQTTKGTKSVKISSHHQELIISIVAKNQNTNAVASREISLRSLKSEPKKPDEAPKVVPPKDKSSNWAIIIAILILIVVIGIFIQTSNRNPTSIDTSHLPQYADPPNNDANSGFQNEVLNRDLSPTETVREFFKLVNEKNYKAAYTFTNNALWQPYENFAKNVWGNLSDLQIDVFMKKDFLSMYGGDIILEAKYSVFDEDKKIKEVRTHDFHLKKNEIGNWQIIRLTQPQSEYEWYEDDPLQGIKNDPMVIVFNRPHALLQDYYDNFSNKNLAHSENGKYYSDNLIVYYGKNWVSREDAVELDYQDFVSNDIFSYKILLNSYGMVTDKVNSLNFVHVPVNYYVTKNDSTRTKYTVSIDALLNEDCSVILAIGQDLTIEQIQAAIPDNVKDEIQKTTTRQQLLSK